jgi:microcystin-dependent protein
MQNLANLIDKEEMNKMKRGLILLFALAALTGFFGAQGAYAGVPQMINYQGTLTNSAGTPVPNGNYNIEFKIYDVASGGAALWSEKWDTTTSQIPVVGGIFNAMLGFQSPIPATFFADHPVTYLGIKVGTDSEMLPRQQITSVGYAFTAGNGVPKRAIIMWSGTIDQIPAGWALCDGNNGTPNLKDKFVLGAGGTFPTTGGEATHTLSIEEMPSHKHTDLGHAHIEQKYDSSNDGTTQVGGGNGRGSNVTTTSTLSSSANIQNTGGGQPHNNLPPYYALAYIMKL